MLDCRSGFTQDSGKFFGFQLLSPFGSCDCGLQLFDKSDHFGQVVCGKDRFLILSNGEALANFIGEFALGDFGMIDPQHNFSSTHLETGTGIVVPRLIDQDTIFH